MENRIVEIFDRVHAEDELKKKTMDYLHAEREKRKARKRNYTLACAALALFLICGGFSCKIYFTPAAYIDIDVNPSIELTLNRLGRVIRTSAYNGDGEKLLDEVSLQHTDYNKALEKLLAALSGDGYFEQDSLLCVTVQAHGDGRESRIQDSLQRTIDIACRNHHYNILAEIFAVTEDTKHCASENKVSPAKYLAIQELLGLDSEADFEECRDQSVHELREQIEEHCSSSEEESHEKESHEDENHSHGHGGGHH